MTTGIDILTEDSRRVLRAAFGDKVGEVWVCWTSNMKGKRVKNLVEGDMPQDEDNYFCVGLMKPGSTRRSLENVSRVYMMVVDENGELLDADGLARLPQGVNTKAGNFKIRDARGRMH